MLKILVLEDLKEGKKDYVTSVVAVAVTERKRSLQIT